MTYDTPYRIENVTRRDNGVSIPSYEVMTVEDGVICKGDNYAQLRRLVDLANGASRGEKAGLIDVTTYRPKTL